MENIETTDVIFRVDNDKDSPDVFAILPHDVCNFDGNVTTFQHIGQHSAGDYQVMLNQSRLAKPDEYKDLKAEMESRGYVFNVMKRRNYNKYLKSYYSVTRA